jgi:2-octaprenyl-6-methoxyphenol hydroxylase
MTRRASTSSSRAAASPASTAAAAFGQAGFSVVLADPAPPVDAAEADGSDLRSTAFLQPARDLFERTGLWEALAPHAMPLEVLRAVDTTGWPPEVRETRDFRADDISDRPFGWNLPNWQTRHVLTGTIARMPKVELRMGTGFARLLTREREAIVTLTDGTTLSARLVVAADGRDSPVREAAGHRRHGDALRPEGLAFNVTHPHPHENVSTELYNQGGAFVLVPLPDLKGGPASAVVWMNDGRRSLDLWRWTRRPSRTRPRCGPAASYGRTDPGQPAPPLACRHPAGRAR